MTTLKNVLIRTDELIGAWVNEFGDNVDTELYDNLSDIFYEFNWTEEDEINVKDYEDSVRFTLEFKKFEEGSDVESNYYTDVKVHPIEGGFDFGIYFGELEEGTIDVDHVTVRNENDYSIFLSTLLEYIEHNYSVAVKHARES